MKVTSSEKWNESNRTKIAFGQIKTALTLLLPMMFGGIYKTMNESDKL